MTKKELVKIIAKKAAVIDTSAKELFDLFLRRLPKELQPGESAQFSNIGHFHFRNGKVVKEEAGSFEPKIEYLDLIIFSPSATLDIKSAGNLIFSVPDSPTSKEDELDAHFSLSVGKPVLPSLEGSTSAVYSTDELQEIMNRKVEGLMVNLRKDESSIADREVLLVDMKQIDRDQYELELDEKTKLKNTETSENLIHSSEQLKSIAWSFGKDLSNQIVSDGLPVIQEGQNETGEPVYAADSETVPGKSSNVADDSSSELTDSAEVEDESISFPFKENDLELKIPEDAVNEFNLIDPESDELDKKIDLTEITNDEVRDRADKLIEESIDADSIAKSLMDEIDKTDLDIEMDDFEVSDNNEKMGKFERVRSISSSYSEFKSIKDIEGFDSFIQDRVDVKKGSVISKDRESSETRNAEIFKSHDEKDKPETVTNIKDKKLSLSKTDPKLYKGNYNRKNSAVKFFIIIAIMTGVVAIIYLLTSNDQNSENNNEVVIPTTLASNTTYIERTYDLPVNYPYSKSENTQLTGLEPMEDKLETGREKDLVDPKTTVKDLDVNTETIVSESSKIPSGSAVQIAYSIYQYNDVYVVQVAAFRSEETASQEVSKYLSLGYNSFVEKATINGVSWYRVRVGNFDSVDKAKQFRSSQQ